MVTYEKRILHGTRGNLKGLDNKGPDKEGQDQVYVLKCKAGPPRKKSAGKTVAGKTGGKGK